MDKISINLNPRKTRKNEVILQNMVTYKPFLILGIIGIFILIFILQLFIFLRMNSYRSYKKEWAKWQEPYDLIAQVKKETAALEQKKIELQKVTLPKMEMAKILAEIYSSLPKNIWLKSFRFKDNSLILCGYAVKWSEDYLTSLGEKFLNSLKEAEYFSSKFKKVNIKDTKKTTFNDVEVLEFNIECAQ